MKTLVPSFAIGFLCAFVGVRTLAPPLTSEQIRTTSGSQLYERLDSGAEVVLLGSSRMYYGIDERILEAETGLKTSNGSIRGLRLQELAEMLDFYLDHSPKARYFVVELLSPQPIPYGQTVAHQTAWYTWPSTRMLVAATWAEKELSLFEKLKFSFEHVQYFALRERVFGAATPPRVNTPGEISNEDDAWRNEHVRTLKEILQGEHGRQYERSAVVAEFYRRIIDRIRERGIVPVFVLLPKSTNHDLDCLDILKSYAAGSEIVDLVSPDANREHYDNALWVDPHHMGGKGARILSRKLGRRLAEHNQPPSRTTDNLGAPTDDSERSEAPEF